MSTIKHDATDACKTVICSYRDCQKCGHIAVVFTANSTFKKVYSFTPCTYRGEPLTIELDSYDRYRMGMLKRRYEELKKEMEQKGYTYFGKISKEEIEYSPWGPSACSKSYYVFTKTETERIELSVEYYVDR